MQAEIIGSSWSLKDLWNESLDTFEERVLAYRDYMYASELGGSFPDRYLKMMGVKFSNPPNVRSRRKFQAGNLTEWVVGMVLRRIGILSAKQVRCQTELPGLLRVSGKLDFIAGGDIDWDRAKEEAKELEFSTNDVPAFFFNAADKIIERMSRDFANMPMKEVVMEVKSISGFVMDLIDKTNEPRSHNVLQNYHYLLGGNFDEGKLVYICRDDCRMTEFAIFKNETFHEIYKNDVEEMTGYFRAGDSRAPMKALPPKEPEIIFELGKYKFNKNWKLEYSPYLSLLYNFETPEHYREHWKPTIAKFNRTFSRCVTGKELTKGNKAAIEEAKELFPDWDRFVMEARALGVNEEEEATAE